MEQQLSDIKIIKFTEEYRKAVVELWEPNFSGANTEIKHRDIDNSECNNPSLFLIAINQDELVATCMGAFDGHCGWIYYLCTANKYRRLGIARKMIQAIEAKLAESCNCCRFGLHINPEERQLRQFYQALGYQHERLSCYSKRVD